MHHVLSRELPHADTGGADVLAVEVEVVEVGQALPETLDRFVAEVGIRVDLHVDQSLEVLKVTQARVGDVSAGGPVVDGPVESPVDVQVVELLEIGQVLDALVGQAGAADALAQV